MVFKKTNRNELETRSMVFKSTSVARGCEIRDARCDGIAIGAGEVAKMKGRWCLRSATLVWWWTRLLKSLPFADVIAHLTAEAYATSNCSPSPLVISENHSQGYIILITWCIKIKLHTLIRWPSPSTSLVLLFFYPYNPKWPQVRIILFVETMG